MKKINQYPRNAIRICIDYYEQGLTGRAFSPLCANVINYSGIQELLLKVDDIFDRVGYPQAFHERRTFWGVMKTKKKYGGIPLPILEAANILEKRGKIQTYDIMITSRRNTSWQGFFLNESGKRIKAFKGELGLVEWLTK